MIIATRLIHFLPIPPTRDFTINKGDGHYTSNYNIIFATKERDILLKYVMRRQSSEKGKRV